MPKHKSIKPKNEKGLTPKQIAMLEALQKTVGVLSPACAMVGIHRQTHYDWLKSHPNYKKAYQEMDEYALDFAETQLFKQMKGGNSSSTIYYLKTQGKKRGYTEDSTELKGTVTINIAPPSNLGE